MSAPWYSICTHSNTKSYDCLTKIPFIHRVTQNQMMPLVPRATQNQITASLIFQ
jgi:hypothetical protein